MLLASGSFPGLESARFFDFMPLKEGAADECAGEGESKGTLAQQAWGVHWLINGSLEQGDLLMRVNF